MILIHHTDCGLQNLDEGGYRRQLAAEVGVTPPWAVASFADPNQGVAQSIRRLQLTPFLRHKDHLRGFAYDVATGMLYEATTGEHEPHRRAPERY